MIGSGTTQKNQDWNRPDRSQSAQEGQRSVANDSSTPGYGAANGKSEPRTCDSWADASKWKALAIPRVRKLPVSTINGILVLSVPGL